MNALSLRPMNRRATLAIALWLLILAIGVIVIARATFTADLSAFLPAHPDARQRVLIEQLQSGVASRTLMLGIEGGDAEARAQASRTLANAMRASGFFEQVQNGDNTEFASTGKLVVDHRYQLSPAVSPQRFTADGLREGIDDTLSLLGTPAGNALKPLLERDPTGETQRIAESLIPARSPRSEIGVWVSRTAPRAVLLATTRGDGSDLDQQARGLESVHAAFVPMQAQGLRLSVTGAPVFSVDSRAAIQREVKLLALVGTVVIGGLLLLAFGSLRALGVALLPVVSGIVAGIAAVALIHGNVHGITLAFGSTLIGEAVDYAIYYLIQARGAASGTGWMRWRERNWPTVRLGLLTSVCGFGALLFSGFPGLAQLGLFSIAGLTGAALATRYVLPVLAPDGAPGQGLRLHLGRLAGQAVRGLPRLRVPFVVLAIAAVAVLAMQWGHLWRGSLGSLSPVSAELQQRDADLRADLGASDASTLVVASGKDVESTLVAAEAAGARLDGLVDSGVLAGYDSPTRFLPSQAVQKARLASIPEPAALRQQLALATNNGPLKAQRLEPFLREVDAARRLPLLDRAALSATALAPAVDAMLFKRASGGWSALISLRTTNDAAVGPKVEETMAGMAATAGIQVVDIKRELNSLYEHYLREALTQALLGALAVVALLAFYLRDVRRLVAVCAPLALAVLFTLAGLALVGEPLGILHLVGLLLVIAVGSNYGLYFDQLRREGQTDDDTLASLLIANLTTVVSFGLIALSDIPALSAIGRVVAPGAFLALVMAAVIATPRKG